MIHEPDVALTDFALALESGLFAYLLGRGAGRARPIARWWGFFFRAACLGALAGGAVHGFFPDERSFVERLLWPVSLIALGAGAMAAWAIGALIGFEERWRRPTIYLAEAEFLIYSAVIYLGPKDFSRAILNYLPAAIFLLVMFVRRWWGTRNRAFLLGAIAMVLTFVAAWVQESRIDFGSKLFSYNALYHLIQAAALLMLFVGARRISEDAKP